jgi:4-nitrophenyl phosphatase
MDFKTIRAVITDMDGVLWSGEDALPGFREFFAFLRGRGIPLMLATNNGMKTPSDYVTKLERLGVTGVAESSIVTSGTTTVDYLRKHYPPGSGVYVLGSDGVRRVLTAGGFRIVDEAPVAVVVGLDQQLTYEKLKRATLLIRAGAAFIATNEDATLPTSEGLTPGAGMMVSALRTGTDQEPIVMGKPNAPMFEVALDTLGCSAAETLMIGDRLDTDIRGAAALGMQTALVLTGVATREQAMNGPVRPDGIYADLAELLAAWG